MTDAATTPPNEGPSIEEPSSDDLKRALKAFKKRLKLTRLDYQSKLGYGPMTNGGGPGIVAIMPPHQFPPAVWEELVRQRKLIHLGEGLYELVAGA